MKFIFSLFLCLIPLSLYAQGVLENMQADIAANKLKTDNLAAELMAQKAKVATLEADMAAQKAVSQALQAELNAEKLKVAALEASIILHKNRLDAIEASIAQLAARVTALENPNPPPPPPPPPTELKLELVGGWRLKGEFARGSMAIDHATMRVWMSGHAARAEVIHYQLPARGNGTDPAAWPVVSGTVIPSWWGAKEYANDLRWDGSKVWVSPKNGYDTAPPATLTHFAQDGETKVYPVPRQSFSGFVKSVNGFELGGGGYESGQGWCKGPSLAKQDGTILIHFPQNSTFDTACPREPNYWHWNGVDDWYAWTPRKADGTKAQIPITDTTGLQGRWASDRIRGGGLRFSHGIYYWVQTGTQDLSYARQSETFGTKETDRCYLFRFDPVTYKLIGWKDWGTEIVTGQEISPDGKYVYLTVRNAWVGGIYRVDPIIKVYEVK